jgi:hypothetical protein
MSDPKATPPTPTPAPTPPAPAPEKTVEYGRYQRVVAAKTNLEAQVTDLQAQLDASMAKAATVDSVVQDRDTWKQKAEQEAGRFERFQTITQATGNGNPEAVELVEFAYNKVPEEGRPELAEWLKGFQEDPSKAPLALQTVFGQVQTNPRPRPKDPKSPNQPPGAPPAVTSEKIAAIRQRAQETRDWSEYEALRKQMGFVRD